MRTEEEIKDQIKILKKWAKKYKHLRDLNLMLESNIELLKWVLGKEI